MNSTAILFALGVVLCWGLYSVFLHAGSIGFGNANPTASRMKAFLLVGVAYFIVGIVGPILILRAQGASWTAAADWPAAGFKNSLIAGFLGAVGAFFLLMALSSGKDRAETNTLIMIVPAIVFAGAPIVNAVVSISKEGRWGDVTWKFWLGVILAAAGVMFALVNRPAPKPPAKPQAAAAAPAPSALPPGYTDVTTRKYEVS